MNEPNLPPTQLIEVCDPQDWKTIPAPVGVNADTQAFADAGRQLRAATGKEENWTVEFRGRGDCSMCYDLAGIHPRRHQNAKVGPEFQVLLMDASEVKAAATFTWTGNIATVKLGLWYMARLVDDADRICSYRVQERRAGKLIREFTCKVPSTQRATATPSDVLKVERWCELNPAELPENGGIAPVNLDTVRIE